MNTTFIVQRLLLQSISSNFENDNSVKLEEDCDEEWESKK